MEMLYHDDLTTIEEIVRKVAREEINRAIRATTEPVDPKAELVDPNAEPVDPNAKKKKKGEDNA